jgi:hypothetical protein
VRTKLETPVVAVAVLCLASMACVDRLPDQDRRILTTPPSAKLSDDALWSDYQADAAAADKKYWGKVIELTGRVSSVEQSPPRILFEQTEDPKGTIEARLLDDSAATTATAAAAGERITLRCFCEGLQGNLILKSCIKP